MDLFLRKVSHPQASDNYRVIAMIDGIEFEVGSIGTTFFTDIEPVWTWGIDTVVPMREVESEGQGLDRKDCTRQFKAAWLAFCSDGARLTEFLERKRTARASTRHKDART
jgi:hypothetical protein